MFQRNRMRFIVAIAGAASLAASLAAQAIQSNCKPVHADLVEDRATTACRPGHTSCFLGDVDGNHGLRGTTYFRGDSGAAGPSTGLPGFVSYSGVFEYHHRPGHARSRARPASPTRVRDCPRAAP